MGTPERQDAGFSLIETLIVAAMLTVLAAYVVPGVRAAQEGYRVQTTAFNVAQKFTEARTDALKRNRPTWLLIDSVTRTAQVQFQGPSSPVNVGAPEQLPQGITFVGIPTVAQVFFDSVGRPTAPPVILQIRSPNGMTRTITIAATGRVTVTQP